MGRHTFQVQPRRLLDSGREVGGLLRAASYPSHPGVDFDVHGNPAATFFRFGGKPFDQFAVAHERTEPVFDYCGELLGYRQAVDKDRDRDRGIPQDHRLFDSRDGQEFDSLLNRRASDFHDSVSVGVCFHGNAETWRAVRTHNANVVADKADVVPKVGKVDDRTGRSHCGHIVTQILIRGNLVVLY